MSEGSWLKRQSFCGSLKSTVFVAAAALGIAIIDTKSTAVMNEEVTMPYLLTFGYIMSYEDRRAFYKKRSGKEMPVWCALHEVNRASRATQRTIMEISSIISDFDVFVSQQLMNQSLTSRSENVPDPLSNRHCDAPLPKAICT